MRRVFLWIVFLCAGLSAALAQKITLTGKVIDGAMQANPCRWPP